MDKEGWPDFSLWWLKESQRNTAYRIMAIIGTIVGAVVALWGPVRYFHLFGR